MKNQITKFSVLLIGFLLGLGMSVQGAVFKTGSVIEVPSNRVIRENFYAAGETIVIRGRIMGDAVVAAKTVIIEGIVDGDIIAAGQYLTITPRRPVEDLRLAGQVITVRAVTSRDTLVAGQTINISDRNISKGDVMLNGETVKVGGFVGGSLKVSAGDVIESKNLRVRYDKNIEKWEKNQASKDISKGFLLALVGGMVVFKLYHLIVLWLIYWAMITLLPKLMTSVRHTMSDSFWPAFGAGVLTLIALPFAWFFFGISLIGIPLIFISLAAIIFYALVYKIYLYTWLGEKVISHFVESKKQSKNKIKKIQKLLPHLYFWLGVVLVFFIKLIPVIGTVFSLIAFFWILGAVVINKKNLFTQNRKKGLI
jgi:hypothetical protein